MMVGAEQTLDDGQHDDGWRARGACRGRDPEMFFPVAARGPEHDRAVAAAKRVCTGCPVLAQCRAWAIEALPHGVAGGLSEAERTAARRTRPARRAPARAATAGPSWVPDGAETLPRRFRGPVIAAGKAALAHGVSREQVAVEFAVTRRTVDRWAADVGVLTDAMAGGAR